MHIKLNIHQKPPTVVLMVGGQDFWFSTNRLQTDRKNSAHHNKTNAFFAQVRLGRC